MTLLLRLVLAGLLAGAAAVFAQGDSPLSAVDYSAPCIECHDFGPDSPVHAVLAGSHGLSGDAQAMAGRRGCPDCHGASAGHMEDPSRIAPDVSFGPRWTSTAAAQDARCLACHEQDTASNWRHSLHMLNNVTCVTCHDLLTWEDRVLAADRQAQVCTTCHKAQKRGIHGMQELAAVNPPCSACHNPHDHETADAEMLANDSAGCRACHTPLGAEALATAPAAASDYHRLTASGDRSCLDCHRGIAHAAADAVTAMVPQAVVSRLVTLFQPGGADSEWLLRDHPGSQPLRQGGNCQQCHRGEEARMGVAQAGDLTPAYREITVAFSRSQEALTLSLRWRGSGDDTVLALMWGDGGSESFRRGGCFAACHTTSGEEHDSGAAKGKYLLESRVERTPPGRAGEAKNPDKIRDMMAAGEFVTLWRLQLDSGQFDLATLLGEVHWLETNLIQIKKRRVDNNWAVEITAPLNNTGLQKPFTTDGKYTFGIALGSASHPGGGHWVSLPLTLSLVGDETDFKVEQ
jgi:nitrate/TMAO reductase-like tetraheme cytochrome c subunit